MEKPLYDDGTMKIEGKYGHLIINGKHFLWGSKDGSPYFKEVPEKEYKELENKSRELAKKLKDGVDAEKILMEIFMTRFDKTELDKLHKALFKGKRKLKTKTREHHCVDLKAGNFIIPLVD